ncbi:hypothetical protein [Pelagibacterium luteolum]|uniref:Uncharacterized protein n=1 Tax=Pelagibacterium luteolum TaxID=440168 RepID=A0A1G7RPS1_9HYPH|nr:hypothetical protein [Pelagibacterium luteolum]SDG12786.1 hypothetical protein SAMN04487974_10143 [Pelagibacterium luteolum]
MSDQKLDRIEAAQAEILGRLNRIETTLQSGGAAHATPPAPFAAREAPASQDDAGKWMKIGVWVLIAIAAIWLLDELPGPSILDRIF